MFWGLINFNQSVNHFKVDNVQNMYCMFYGNRKFNKPLNFWNVSNVISMDYMFLRIMILIKVLMIGIQVI